jgi:hypothetical protein
MGLIRKLVEQESKVLDKEMMATEPKPKRRRTITTSQAREEGGREIAALKRGLEDNIQVKVSQAGSNKYKISILFIGTTLRMSEVRKLIKADPSAENLNVTA